VKRDKESTFMIN